MGINFPASPLVGDKYPTPAQAGIPQYTWDGTIWRAQTPPSTFVKLAGDTMTGDLTLPRNAASALHAVPKQQLDARVLDVAAYSGMQVNGAMDVSQEFGFVAPITGNNNYVCDGWYISNSAAATINSLVYNSGGPPGITSRLECVTATATTPAGAQLTQVFQPIEGYRIARLGWGTANAQPITIGFWTGHQRTGIYSVVVRNSADNRSCAATYTQNVSGSWEYKTVTIPGDTAGTWLVNNLTGLRICFTLASGPTMIAPATNTWYGATYGAAPGQVNGVGAITDVFRLTGVVVLPGIEAPSAARSALIMRPFDQELLTCKRYFQKSYAYGSPLGTSTGFGNGIVDLTGGPVFDVDLETEMRALPTINTYDAVGNGGRVSTEGANNNVVITAADNIGTKRFKFYSAAITRLSFNYSADARL